MPWTYYTPGEIIGPHRIIEVVEKTPRQPTTMYLCALVCCGKQAVKSHAYIADKASKGATACRACYLEMARDADPADPAPVERKRSRAQKPAQPAARTPAPVAPVAPEVLFRKGVTVNGQFWPSLGRMGPRFGASQYRDRCGTGDLRLMDQEAA